MENSDNSAVVSVAVVAEQNNNTQREYVSSKISGRCFWCGFPLYADCFCEFDNNSDLDPPFSSRDDDEELEGSNYFATEVIGEYFNEDDWNIRDFDVGNIYTADWDTKEYPFLWNKFYEHEQWGNMYANITWNMFEINQYLNYEQFEDRKYDAIYRNLNELYYKVDDFNGDELENPYYYVANCRYFTFIRWLILTPHLSFLKKMDGDLSYFNKKLFKACDFAIWLLDEIYNFEEQNPRVNSIPNPYANTEGDVHCRDECVEQITEFIKVCKSILIIQRFARKTIYKRKTIYQVYTFNTLLKERPNVNLDCIQKILCCI